MTAYQIAQTITLAVAIALGIAGLTEWFLIVIISMIITAGAHALTNTD